MDRQRQREEEAREEGFFWWRRRRHACENLFSSFSSQELKEKQKVCQSIIVAGRKEKRFEEQMMKSDASRQRPVSVALTDSALHNEFAALEREQAPNRAAAFPLGKKPSDSLTPHSLPKNDSSLQRGLRVRAVASSSDSTNFRSPNPNPLPHGHSHLNDSSSSSSSPSSLSLPSGLPPSSSEEEEDDQHHQQHHAEETASDSLRVSGQGEGLQKGHKPELTKFRGGKSAVRRRRSILPHLDSLTDPSADRLGVPQCSSSPSLFVSQQQDQSLSPSSSNLPNSASSPSVERIQVQVQVQMTTKSEYGEADLSSCTSMPLIVTNAVAAANPKVLASSVSTYDLQNMRLKKLPLWDVRRSPGLSETLSAGRAMENSANSVHPSEISPLHLAGYQLMSFPENLPDIDKSTAMISHLHPMQFYEKHRTVSDETFIFTFMRRHDLTFEQKKDEFGHLNQSLSRMGIEKLPHTERVPSSSLIILGNRNTGIPYVKSGTINSLFRMLCDDLTRQANPYSLLEATLLLTYPLFSSSDLVLSTFGYLIASYLQIRKNPKELKCIGDALYHWVGLIPEDFDGSEGADTLKKLNFLLSQCHSSHVVPLSFVERNRQYIQRVRAVAIPPTPILPMNLHGGFQSLNLMVLDPIEVARQMALRSFQMFELISPREWLNTAHNETDHISKMSKDFNFTANFFAEAILDSSDVDTRADVICRCIAIAEASLKIRNFHTFMAILCSLNSAAISRLQKTWKAFKKNKEVYQKYLDLGSLGEMDNNFLSLREVCQVTPDIPAIPYLGLFLSDITFIIDGNR